MILPQSCGAEIPAAIHNEIGNFLNTATHTLVNGILAAEFHESWIEILTLLKNKLVGTGKKLRLINFKQEFEEVILKSGVGNKQLFSNGVQEALKDFSLPPEQSTKINFIKGFIQTTPRIIYVQTQVLCKQKKLSIKKGDLGLLPGDISGIVTVSAPELHYAILLCFPRDTFLKLMSKMLGETFSELNKDIQDGAAETLNIIYGQVRSLTESNNPNLKASIPIVFVGNRITTLEFHDRGTIQFEEGKVVAIPFETELGEFFIEAWMPKDVTGNFLA
jgi:CheY-specific phosphatase CheX